jgi:hypothetical protein
MAELGIVEVEQRALAAVECCPRPLGCQDKSKGKIEGSKSYSTKL